MTRSHAHRIATVVLPVVAGLTIALTGLLVDPSPARGEDVEATHCFTGTFTAISGSQELTSASHWAHHGIVRSSNKKFENAATYCGGANRGTGPTRQGYVLCRMVDADGDIIMIHDPQPAGLVALRRRPGQSWVWRCHIDLSNPDQQVWDFLEPWVARYDAAIFSAAAFVRRLPIPSYLAPPSIDPFADKNRELTELEMERALEKLNVLGRGPIVCQVSRFDRLKDPVGVVAAFARVRRKTRAHLVLAGGGADDDPEGAAVLAETREAAKGVKDVTLLDLPNDSNIEINALQRASAVVLQKSLREGFALTVSEALWKERAVVASAVGGIPLQILHGRTGLLVRSIEGTAVQVLKLLDHAALRKRLGQAGRAQVRRHFLLPRETRDYLAVSLSALLSRRETAGVRFDGRSGAPTPVSSISA